MNFSFHPEAEKEFVEAIDYYEEREENLDLGFARKSTPRLAARQNIPGLGPSLRTKCVDARQSDSLMPCSIRKSPTAFSSLRRCISTAIRTTGRIV